METSSAEFFVDADDWIANRDGLAAVQMMVAGLSTGGGGKRFRFRPATLSQPVQVEWDIDDDYQIFPREIATVMVRKGYARKAPDDFLKAINADMGEVEKEEPAPEAVEPPKSEDDTPPAKKRGRPKKEPTDGQD